MITIDYQEGYIRIISDIEPVAPLCVVSQLNFWGFKTTECQSILSLPSKKPGTILVKMAKYLQKEGVAYEVTSHVARIFEEQRQIIAEYEDILQSARSLKSNIFDRKLFEDFLAFTRRALVRKLRDHQLKAAFHLLIVKNGANFSVPGSGKTSVVLAVYENLRQQQVANCLFVVGPPSCFGPWRTEFEETLGRKPNYVILSGGDQISRKSAYFKPLAERAELYLSTYHTLLNDLQDVATFISHPNCHAFFVVDEAHYMKQLGGEWAEALLKIAPLAQFRVVLTGTPMPRSYVDIFNLFDFLWPANPPLSSSQKIQIELSEKKNDPKSVIDIFERTIEPLMYRVRKTDLDLLPPCFHPPIQICMNQYERKLYDAIMRRIRGWAMEDYLKNIELIHRLIRGRMIRVRQSLSYCTMLNSGVENYNENIFSDDTYLAHIIHDYDSLETPAKLNSLKDLVLDLLEKRQKVLIWANFRATLHLIQRAIASMGYHCDMIYGDTPTQNTPTNEERTREAIRDEFVDPESGLDVLIANPAACAESISLHKTCFHAIYYDLSYNCAQYLQSLDRIHRVGGSENNIANYYFLQYSETMEPDIKLNLDRKAQKMYQVVDKEFPIYSLNMFEEDDDGDAYRRIFLEKSYD